jgi:A/G-specific adenine glycosylase
MWQLPSGEVRTGESTAAAAARLAREAVDLKVTPGAIAGVVRHGVTRYRITLEGRHCLPASAEPRALGCADWAWTTVDEMARFALPAPQRRLVEQIRRAAAEGRPPAAGQIPLLDI